MKVRKNKIKKRRKKDGLQQGKKHFFTCIPAFVTSLSWHFRKMVTLLSQTKDFSGSVPCLQYWPKADAQENYK